MDKNKKLQKKLEKKEYRQKVKENKKYIKNKTINKNIPKQSSLEPNVCINVENAWKIVANEDKRYNLIKDICTSIYKNQFLMIFGESGSGKTTFLSILSALDRPSEGNVNILGNNTACLKNSKLSKLRNKYIGYIFQQYGLLKEVSVLENILVTTNHKTQQRIFKINRKFMRVEKTINHRLNKYISEPFLDVINDDNNNWTNDYIDLNFYELNLPNINLVNNEYIFKNKFKQFFTNIANEYIKKYRDYLFDNEYIYKILKKLEISQYLNSDVNNLSGGQQQRVSIARAISKKPQILFADEPTGAVDAKTAKCILELFLDLMKTENTTIIMVTHNNNLINLSDRVLVLNDGKIVDDKINNNKLSIDQINFE